MSVAGRSKMYALLFIGVLLLAAPLILYASPVIVYLLPFILVGLGLSLFADYVRHKERAARH
jgi:inner membrane protein involved in colicin E2 resistance